MLEYKKIDICFKKNKPLFENFNLDINLKGRTAILGPNGAGKSTLFKLGLGIHMPHSGEVLISSEPADSNESKNRVGASLQNADFPPYLKPLELIDLVSAHADNPISKDEIIERFLLSNILKSNIEALSGGERRKLSLAMAFINRPKFVFLDEPSTGLDYQSRQSIFNEMKLLLDELDAGLLVCSHHMDEIEHFANEILVLNKGKIIDRATLSEIKTKYCLSKVHFCSKAVFRARDFEKLEDDTSLDGSKICWTSDLDATLKNLFLVDSNVSNIKVSEPSLDDIFLKLF